MSNRKRGRGAPAKSRFGCANEQNDLLVEEMRKLQSRTKESSHLFHNYARAVGSVQRADQVIASAQDAIKLRHIGSFIANQIQAILNRQRNSSSNNNNNHASSGNPPTKTMEPSTTVQAVATNTSVPGVEIDTAANPSETSTQASESLRSSRQYAPTIGKQPWLVLVVLRKNNACSESSAVEKSVLLEKMQLEGYDGSLSKLQTCLASLCGTHQVVAKSSTGRFFLTVKGISSADDCVLAIPSEVTRSQQSVGAAPYSASSSSSWGRQAGASTSDHQVITLCSSDEDEDEDDRATLTHASTDATESESERETEPCCSEETPPMSTSCSSSSSSSSTPIEPATTTTEAFLLPLDLIQPNDRWELVLVLDHREILSRRNRCLMEAKLLEKYVTCEVRALNIGDALWIARRVRAATGQIYEYVLNVIVERKEVSDLSGSIMDKRYLEQKSRLKESGLTNVIYLVEGTFTQQHTAIRSNGLFTALCRTQVQDDFFVQWCRSADETIAFLASVHQSLLQRFPFSNPERQPPPSPPKRYAMPSNRVLSGASSNDDLSSLLSKPLLTFDEFNVRFRKKTQFTTGEVYQMMLMQIPGLSSIKAQGLATAFPSFHKLLNAMQSGDRQVGNVSYGKTQRRFGKKTESFLHKLLLGTTYAQDQQPQQQQQ